MTAWVTSSPQVGCSVFLHVCQGMNRRDFAKGKVFLALAFNPSVPPFPTIDHGEGRFFLVLGQIPRVHCDVPISRLTPKIVFSGL